MGLLFISAFEKPITNTTGTINSTIINAGFAIIRVVKKSI